MLVLLLELCFELLWISCGSGVCKRRGMKYMSDGEQRLWLVSAEKEAYSALGYNPLLISLIETADAQQTSGRGRTWKWSGERGQWGGNMEGGLCGEEEVRSPRTKGSRRWEESWWREADDTPWTESKCFYASELGHMWSSCGQIRTHWTELRKMISVKWVFRNVFNAR